MNGRIDGADAGNLSELEVTLGRLEEAVADARRAVEFADRREDASQKMVNRTTAADALHQTGQREEATALFAEAEQMQAKRQPEFPLLYSLQGFRYADLLLFPAERAAWQAVLRGKDGTPVVLTENGAQGGRASACAEGERRAAFALEVAVRNHWLLDIALDHLTLARTRLYRALFSAVPEAEIRNLQSEIPAVLGKLRQANTLDQLPKALLTAALYYGSLGNQPDEVRRYLAEAQQIAERGPMPLYLADVHPGCTHSTDRSLTGE